MPPKVGIASRLEAVETAVAAIPSMTARIIRLETMTRATYFLEMSQHMEQQKEELMDFIRELKSRVDHQLSEYCAEQKRTLRDTNAFSQKLADGCQQTLLDIGLSAVDTKQLQDQMATLLDQACAKAEEARQDVARLQAAAMQYARAGEVRALQKLSFSTKVRCQEQANLLEGLERKHTETRTMLLNLAKVCTAVCTSDSQAAEAVSTIADQVRSSQHTAAVLRGRSLSRTRSTHYAKPAQAGEQPGTEKVPSRAHSMDLRLPKFLPSVIFGPFAVSASAPCTPTSAFSNRSCFE